MVFDVGGSERARIDTSGRLLVGTSTGFANTTVQIQGGPGGTTDAPQLALSRGLAPASISSGQFLASIDFTANNGGKFATIEAYADATPGNNDYPGRLVFSTTADGASSPTERMRIQADGVVKVAGDSWTLGRTYIGNSGASGSGIGTSSNGANSTTLYIGNAAIQVSSDARLKENIEDTSLDALDAISQIRVKDFTWNDPTDTSSNNRNARGKWTGLIAQELVGVLPFVVNAPRKEADGSIDHESQSTWTLDQSQLCPVLIKAVQQQQEIIASLEARIAALETP